jgi:DNA invertase Pin-like site-specific DNA recombinase
VASNVSRSVAGAVAGVMAWLDTRALATSLLRPRAKAIGATVVFAKLDRLTRNVELLRAPMASDDLVFCDLPHVPLGAMGRFLLTQMASVAELEVVLISERTKAALVAAKARINLTDGSSAVY